MTNPNSAPNTHTLPPAEQAPDAVAEQGPLPSNVHYLAGQEAFELGGQREIHIIAVDAVQELGHIGITHESVRGAEAEITAAHGAEGVADAAKAKETLEAKVAGDLLDAITDRKNGGVNAKVAETLNGLSGRDERVLEAAVATQASGNVVSMATKVQLAKGLERNMGHEAKAA